MLMQRQGTAASAPCMHAWPGGVTTTTALIYAHHGRLKDLTAAALGAALWAIALFLHACVPACLPA